MPRPKAEMLHDDVAGVARAAQVLRDGGLLALPTETVYGLAADARNGHAVARIFEAKGRPAFNPLIVHALSLSAVADLVELPEQARALADAFWPGPMTLVLPSKGGVADLVSGGLETLAVRIPAHPLARRVLEEFGGPVAAPSANPSGKISPTLAQHVMDGLGDRIEAILDGGACGVGLESTILAPAHGATRLLREGGISREDVEAIVGTVATDLTPGRVEAPGQMERHYAPRTRLILDTRDKPRGPQSSTNPDEVKIGFGVDLQADFSLSEQGDVVEAAERLFATLHAADALATARGATTIRVAAIPNIGLGRAINDRLGRAAK